MSRIYASIFLAALLSGAPLHAAKQTINVGGSANDGTGDTLRSAMQKTNANFTELYNTDVSLDVRIDDIEADVTALQSATSALDTRLDTAESDIGALETVDTALDGRLDTAEGNITTLQSGKQPIDSELTAIAALSPSDGDVIQRATGAWAARTMAQLKTSLSLDKSDVGLGNVDNTSDATKNAATVTLTNKAISGSSNTLSNIPSSAITGLTKSDVGLGNVDNTSDATKNAATVTLTNKTLTAPVINSPTGIVKADVGLGNVENTALSTWSGSTNLTSFSPNVPLINAANVFTNSMRWSNAAPITQWYESDAGTDLKLWDCGVDAGIFACRTRTDADGAGNIFLSATRGTTTALTNVTIGYAGTHTYTFPSTGTASFSGQIQSIRFNANANSTAPNEGLYRPAASTVALSSAAVTRAWIDTKFGVQKSGITMSASERVAVGGITYTNTTTTGNTAATETDAFSHTVSAGTLGTNGETIEFEAAGTFAGTVATNKRIKVVFGSTTVFDTGSLAITSASGWMLKGTIVRTGATTQKVVATLSTGFTSVPSITQYSTASETLANALTLKLTVNATNANDVVGEFFKEKWFPFM